MAVVMNRWLSVTASYTHCYTCTNAFIVCALAMTFEWFFVVCVAYIIYTYTYRSACSVIFDFISFASPELAKLMGKIDIWHTHTHTFGRFAWLRRNSSEWLWQRFIADDDDDDDDELGRPEVVHTNGTPNNKCIFYVLCPFGSLPKTHAIRPWPCSHYA